LAGHTDLAIARLEEAVQIAPRDAGTLSDLAAAYLARAGSRDPPEPEDRIYALAAADKALALDRALPAARFNRALALEQIGLWPEALKAWQGYRAVDSSSGWSEEARTRIAVLEERLRPESWDHDRGLLNRVTGGGEVAAVREIVTRRPQESRMYAEEVVLARWAAAETAGLREEAGRELAIARTVGAVLAAAHGDRLLSEAVAAIDAAGSRTDGKLAALARGHLLYREALDEYEPLHLAAARPLFRSAREALAEGGSPFTGWADLHLAICDFYDSQYPRSLEALALLGERARREGALSLLARCRWIAGLDLYQQTALTDALTSLRESLALFERLGETENVASLHDRIALCLSHLGEPAESWRSLDRALALRGHVSSPRRLYTIFYTAQDMALHLGEPAVALYFLDETVAAARTWKSPQSLVEALWSRSRVRDLLGLTDHALSDLREAESHLAGIRDPTSLLRVRGDIRWVTAEARLPGDARAAIRDFTTALDLYRDAGYPDRLIDLHLERGRAALAVGEDDAAEDDFEQAITLYEGRRQKVKGGDFRISYFDQAASVFDQMVLFQAVRRGQPLRALDDVEQARARVLLDSVAGAQGHLPGPFTGEQIAARVPAGVALIEYAVLQDRVLIWTVRKEGVVLVSQSVGADRLATLVDRFRSEISRGRAAESRTARELYRLLVHPALAGARDSSLLVFIPDKSLHALPFAALPDSDTGRPLIEESTVAISPSATLFLLAREHDRELSLESPGNVLVVGNPTFDEGEHPGLEDLPAAEAEAREVGGGYPGAQLLLGADATKRAFLKAAPEATILHLALHAIANPVAPSRSRLVLAPEPGQPASGSLFAVEIGRLELPRTRLVVLGACETAEGRIWKTEGAESLARPFLAAGVPAVVASLWPVDDDATALLFTEFHRQIRRGIDPATALREAQRAMIASPDERWRQPSMWAGFELIGGVTEDSPGLWAGRADEKRRIN
jgi:CHAT domain-containing protein/tetratricopeptide (TPR) repeat protein